MREEVISVPSTPGASIECDDVHRNSLHIKIDKPIEAKRRGPISAKDHSGSSVYKEDPVSSHRWEMRSSDPNSELMTASINMHSNGYLSDQLLSLPYP